MTIVDKAAPPGRTGLMAVTLLVFCHRRSFRHTNLPGSGEIVGIDHPLA
ncbi:MAG: hypothetical protein R3D05_11010 [Dongiaceae bacterium]